MTRDTPASSDNAKAQMRKGILEFCAILIIAQGEVYASDILQKLREADLLVVEGTLYPILSRLKNDELVSYEWRESRNGPPRKYYTLTKKGKESLKDLTGTWNALTSSITSLLDHA
ncbi:MAG: PadR family transcriptional regulator [Candidatus Peribacteraceae bacterium]|nr:PadR family transcriptional regulator [Candidatus Peribacteraceae bacterium]